MPTPFERKHLSISQSKYLTLQHRQLKLIILLIKHNYFTSFSIIKSLPIKRVIIICN